MRRLMLGVMLACAAHAAPAQTAAILGSGNSTCSNWTKQRAERNLEGVTYSERSAQWVAGYLRGAFDHISADRRDPLADSDMSSITGWLDSYCRDHPLNTLYQAASELSGELIRRSAR